LLKSASFFSPLRSRHVVQMAKGVDFESMDGSELRVGIVHAKWGKDMISQLVKDAKSSLLECKVKDENIVEVEVFAVVSIWLLVRKDLEA